MVCLCTTLTANFNFDHVKPKLFHTISNRIRARIKSNKRVLIAFSQVSPNLIYFDTQDREWKYRMLTLKQERRNNHVERDRASTLLFLKQTLTQTDASLVNIFRIQCSMNGFFNPIFKVKRISKNDSSAA
jgi:hypothetical protein